MEKDVLGEVIEVEREIQQCILREQQQAGERLDLVKREAEEEIRREEKALRESLERERIGAQREAEQRARQMTQEAAARAARLGELDDATLTGILLKRVPRILRD
jgi:hypothetical protein